MSQSKNQYYISGALLLLQPITSRPYTSKAGELIENKERVIVIRHKASKYGKWVINDITVHCVREAVEQLELMRPGLEVIADFSIEVIAWTPKEETEERRFQKLVCNKIMSPTDKYKSEKWWRDEHRQPSRTVKTPAEKEEDKPIDKLNEQEQKRRNPETEDYHIKSYDKTADYSTDGSEEIKEKEPPISVDKPDNSLPF